MFFRMLYNGKKTVLFYPELLKIKLNKLTVNGTNSSETLHSDLEAGVIQI